VLNARPMNFATRVDRAARTAPERSAVSDPDETLSYRELARASDRVASALAALDVAPDDRVAIAAPNGVAFVATHLGVLKRGALSVPLNQRFDERQAEYVCSDAGADLVVTVGDDATVGTGGRPTATYAALRDRGSPDHEPVPRKDDDDAELLYTSGATGAPKGVFHTHGNLSANARALVHYKQWTREDVALTVCPCFHVTGLNITTTPFIGLEATNHLLPTWDPEAVLAAIETREVTYTFLTPTMALDLLEADTGAYDLSSLDTVGVGGSPMPSERVDEVEAALGCALLEGYGMTETTPLAAFTRPDDAGRKPGSVGRPAAQVVDLRVEDPDTGEVVEQGARGELLWAGDTVTPRYTREGLTADRFVRRPAGTGTAPHDEAEPGPGPPVGDGGPTEHRRWLRSGDIGYLDEDGFHVVDRLADMFTTGCGDVHPREIEAVIYGLDAVDSVAVVDSRDDVRGTTVTAVVRTREGASLDAERVIRACERDLADHEVPDRVEFVEDLPTTATGKVDRRRLRDLVT
jgi:long-chain acyl-CoA synthetase